MLELTLGMRINFISRIDMCIFDFEHLNWCNFGRKKNCFLSQFYSTRYRHRWATIIRPDVAHWMLNKLASVSWYIWYIHEVAEGRLLYSRPSWGGLQPPRWAPAFVWGARARVPPPPPPVRALTSTLMRSTVWGSLTSRINIAALKQ